MHSVDRPQLTPGDIPELARSLARTDICRGISRRGNPLTPLSRTALNHMIVDAITPRYFVGEADSFPGKATPSPTAQPEAIT